MTLALSLIIPTRNREKYLLHLVQMIGLVKSQNIEFLIVDNSDQPLAKSSLSDDPRLRVVRNPTRLSMASNWEFGLVNALAPWRTFIGDDDGFIPSELDRLVEQLESSKADAVVASFAHYYWPTGPASPGTISVWKTSKQKLRHLGLTGNVYKDFSNIYFPIPYARTVFSSDLEKKVREAQGGVFFTASSPDINSGAAISLFASTIDYIVDVVPFIVGTSPASNGVAKSNDETKVDFFRLSDREWLQELGFEGKSLNLLSYIEPIAQVRKASGQALDLPGRGSLIWGTLLSSPLTREMSHYLVKIFPEHTFRIRALALLAFLIYPALIFVRKWGWAASRVLLNGERYFRRKSHSLRTIKDASTALEAALRSA